MGSAQITPPGAAGAGRLRECPSCGLFQQLPPVQRGEAARCPRCHTLLRRHRVDPQGRALAMALTGLLLFAIATQLPFMELDLNGRGRVTTLVTGPIELEDQGLWELSAVVLVTTIAAPLAKLLAMIWVLIGVRLRHPSRHLHVVLRWVERLSPWSMIEVFLLGVFVAYTKLVDLAHIEVGGAVYALGGLMLAMAAADAAMDHTALWETIEQKGITAAAMPPPPAPGARNLVGCDCCGLVSTPDPATRRPTCPRCGAALRFRRPNSASHTIALLLAAVILYIPANLLPVMTVISFGQGTPDTILSGVLELASAGMWPLAALVFVASITVPVVKLLGLATLLITTKLRARARLHERTVLYHLIDAIGRWSMIDVFMVSILTALVRLDAIASISPGPGVVSFCAVVILTMLAAMSFDPRLMWDAAQRSEQPQ